MQLTLTNQYDVPGTDNPLNTYEDACIKDVNCPLTSYRKMGNNITVLKNSVEGDVLERELLIQPNPDSVPATLRSLAGDDAFDCIQTTRYDFATHTGSVDTRMTGGFLKDRFNSSAQFKVRCDTPDSPRKVSYEASTKIEVSIFVVGGKIANSLAAQMKERQPATQEFNQQWLNAGPAQEGITEETTQP